MKKFLFVLLFTLSFLFKIDSFAYDNTYTIVGPSITYTIESDSPVVATWINNYGWFVSLTPFHIISPNMSTSYYTQLIYGSNYGVTQNFYGGRIGTFYNGKPSPYYPTLQEALNFLNTPPSQYVDIDGWDGFWILASYVWCSDWEYIGPDMKLNPKFDPYVYVITNPLINSIDKLFGIPNTATNLSRIDVILDGSVIGSFNYDTESYTQQGGYFRIDKTKIGSDGYVDLEFKPYTREGNFGDSQICSINMKPSLDPYSNAYVQRYKSPNTGKEYQYLGTTNTKTTYHNPSTGVTSPVRKTSNPSVLVSTPIGVEPTGNELPPDSPSTPEPTPNDPTPPPSEPDPTPSDPTPPSGTISPTPPPSGGLPKPTPSDPTPKPDININIKFDFGDLWDSWNKIKAKLDEGFSLFDNLVDDLRNYGIPEEVVIALGAVIATIIIAAVLKLMIVIVKVILEILPL